MKLITGRAIIVLQNIIFIPKVHVALVWIFFGYISSLVAVSDEKNEQSRSTPLTLSPSKRLRDQNLSHNFPYTQHTASQIVECPYISTTDRCIN